MSAVSASGEHSDLLGAVELLRGRTIVALTGAGCSTESGIPDYRGPTTREPARKPMQHATFVGDADARRRYWARAMVGWPRFAAASPNEGHRALAELERAGCLLGTITQNVDRLHQAAGSRRVIELHGALHDVVCLHCEVRCARAQVQVRLQSANPGWDQHAARLAPDGDADLPSTLVARFEPVSCEHCDGPLKPDVVFFGGSVPPQRVRQAYELLDRAEVLLVAGSSLAVFSGYRFVRAAERDGKPIVIANLGPTRGDPLATLKLEGRLGELLPALTGLLLRDGGTTRP